MTILTLPVSRFQNFLCPASDDGSSSNNSGRSNVSKVYCQEIVEPTEVETHLSIKLSKKNFGGILRPKSCKENVGHRVSLWGREQISSLI